MSTFSLILEGWQQSVKNSQRVQNYRESLYCRLEPKHVTIPEQLKKNLSLLSLSGKLAMRNTQNSRYCRTKWMNKWIHNSNNRSPPGSPLPDLAVPSDMLGVELAKGACCLGDEGERRWAEEGDGRCSQGNSFITKEAGIIRQFISSKNYPKPNHVHSQSSILF